MQTPDYFGMLFAKCISLYFPKKKKTKEKTKKRSNELSNENFQKKQQRKLPGKLMQTTAKSEY